MLIIVAFLWLFMPAAGILSDHETEKVCTETELQDTIQIRLAENIDLFDTDEPLNITFTFPIRDFLKSKKNPEYIDALIAVHLSDHDSIIQEIRIKARGDYRRSVCEFPPIMINPRKEDSTIQIFSDNRNIKLVTHCRKSTYYEDYVLKEFLIYKFYNLITNYSLRVRLAEIKYVDEADPENVISRYGFLIENIYGMADRNNAVVLDNEKLRQQDMIPEMMTRMAVFEYMIGNVDWQLGKSHNIEIIKSLDILTPKGIPVPYDFDFSGLVDAPYAVPRRDLGIQTVQQRIYLGICLHQDEWNEILNEFEKLKGGLYDAVYSFEFLDNKNKQEVISYLNEFYNLIQNRDAFLYRMRSECRQELNIINIIR